jgi:hypothetical protein
MIRRVEGTNCNVTLLATDLTNVSLRFQTLVQANSRSKDPGQDVF